MSDGTQKKFATTCNKRSCKRCSERKVRCDRNSPCAVCAKAGDLCTFPGPRRAPRTINRPPVKALVARLAELETEVQHLRSKYHDLDKDERQSNKSSTLRDNQSLHLSRIDPGLFDLRKGGFLGYNSPVWSHDSFRQHYLHPLHIETLWRTYHKRVAPLIALLHLPTTARIVQDASKGLDIDSSSEALLLSVCFAAIVSLCPGQFQSELGLEYHEAKSAYELALYQALSRADFIRSPGLLTLQAAVLHLLCARVDGDTRLVWFESAVVIRLAQSQGIHRDGKKIGLSPFDTEIRRRLWWHICILDMLCSEDQGIDMQIRPGTFDAQFPVNVDGDELEPLMLELPPERNGFTDIALCITTSFMIKEVHLSPQLLDPVTSLEDREDHIKSVGKTLHERYLNHFNLGIPAHWVLATITRLHLSKSWVTLHSQFSSSNSGEQKSQYVDSVFLTAIELVEFAYFLQTNDVTAQWSWLCRSYKQKDTISYILDELSYRLPSPETYRAWEVVTKTTSLWRQCPLGTAAEPETPLLELIQRADLLREEKLEREMCVSGSCTNPSTLAWLQGIWPYQDIEDINEL